MSDDETPEEPETPAPAAAEESGGEVEPASGAVATMAPAEPATPTEPTVPAAPATPAEPVSFWDRPYVERYLIPLILPLLVILFVVVYVLNISRLFLSGHGHIPVIVGTVITLIILLGSTIVSGSAHRLRQSVIILVSAGFILSIVSGGWLVLGSAQEKDAGPSTLPATLKTKQTIKVVAAPGGALKFVPAELTGKTGLATIDVNVAAGGHTFDFDDTSTLLGQLTLTDSGSTVKGTAYFANPGKYTFYCAIPGHRAAGMAGTLTVTGPPVPTLQAALTAAGDTEADLKAGG